MNSGNKGNPWIIMCIFVLIALILRSFYLFHISSWPSFEFPQVDAGYHDAWGRAIATGDWHFSEVHDVARVQETSFFRPPGHPYLLAIGYSVFGPSYWVPRILQSVLGLLSLIIAFVIAKRWFGKGLACFWALAFSTYWGFIYFEGELLEPSLLIFCDLLLIYFLGATISTKKNLRGGAFAFMAGVAMGVHAVTRPNILLFAPVAVIWLSWTYGSRYRKKGPWLFSSLFVRRFWSDAVALTLGTCLIVFACTARNYFISGDFVLVSSNGGVNLYIGNNDNANGLFVGTTGEFGAFGTSSKYEEIVDALSEEQGRRLSYADVDSYFAERAVEWIRANPLRALRLSLRKFVYLCSSVETGHNRIIYYDRRRLPVIRYLPGNWGVWFAGAVGAFVMLLCRTRRDHKKLVDDKYAIAWIIALFCICYGVSFLPFFVTGQYRMPLVPWLMLGSVVALRGVWRLMNARRWLSLCLFCFLVGAAFVASVLNLNSFVPNEAKWYYDKGVAYEQVGAPQKALNVYKKTLQHNPEHADAHYNSGRIYAADGKIHLAEASFRKVLQSGAGDQASANNNLGNLLLRSGRANESLSCFRVALEYQPENVEFMNNMAAGLSASGRSVEAIGMFRRVLTLDQDIAFAHMNLGILLLQSGDIGQARNHFLIAGNLKPELRGQIRKFLQN